VNSFMLTLEDYLDAMEVRCFKLNLSFLWFICENVGGVCSRWVLAAYLIYQRYAESLVRFITFCLLLYSLLPNDKESYICRIETWTIMAVCSTVSILDQMMVPSHWLRDCFRF
jgi:hypothetical protein